MTQLYEQALRPFELHGSQFTVLQVLRAAGEVNQRQLGKMLAMDSTTLTRTLAISRRRGWIEERRGQDRRERLLRLSKEGEKQLKRATPAWEQVQARLRGNVGDDRWAKLQQLMNEITNLVTSEGVPL